jgi:hypothetical protein
VRLLSAKQVPQLSLHLSWFRGNGTALRKLGDSIDRLL